ncbi:MAG: hypothetical protein PHQ98_04455 [Candidatus ainarchaeum sp.]|nr:hypothetical protein [Candidatus ainarchaeum sp.]
MQVFNDYSELTEKEIEQLRKGLELIRFKDPNVSIKKHLPQLNKHLQHFQEHDLSIPEKIVGIRQNGQILSYLMFLQSPKKPHEVEIMFFYSAKPNEKNKKYIQDFVKKFGIPPGIYLVNELIRKGVKRFKTRELMISSERLLKYGIKRGLFVLRKTPTKNALKELFFPGNYVFETTERMINSANNQAKKRPRFYNPYLK